MEITASILDYLGTYDGGIFVSIGLMYRDKYYDAIFYYTQNKMLINVDDRMTKDLGCEIEEHEHYLPLLKSIILQCERYHEVIDQLPEINISI
jgi:hypothetical protein